MSWTRCPRVSCTTSPCGGRCTTSTWSFSGSCYAPFRQPKPPRDIRPRPGGTSRMSPRCSGTRSTPGKATWRRRCARSTSTTWPGTAPTAEPGHAVRSVRPRKRRSGRVSQARPGRPCGPGRQRGPEAGPGGPPAHAGWALLALVQHALDLEGDRDLLADGDAAAGDRAVVADAEVVPVDLAAGGEARPRAAVGVRAEAVDLKLQRDRPGGAADGEVAVEQEIVAVGAHTGGVKGQRGMRLDLEEVRAPDVVVPIRLTGVHRAQVDGSVDARLQRVLGGDDGPFELVEAAADFAHHHVPDDEGHLRVHGVYGPGPGDVAGDLHGCLGHCSSR